MHLQLIVSYAYGFFYVFADVFKTNLTDHGLIMRYRFMYHRFRCICNPFFIICLAALLLLPNRLLCCVLADRASI